MNIEENLIPGLLEGKDYFFNSKKGDLILKSDRAKQSMDSAWDGQAWPFRDVLSLKPNDRGVLIIHLDEKDPDISYVHQILQVYASK